MSGAEAHASRRSRAERQRMRVRGALNEGKVKPLAPLPQLRVPWAPLEIFNEEQIAALLDGVWRVLEEFGIEILNDRAREIYGKHGASVDEDNGNVRLGRDLVRELCAHAPERFILRARNRARDLHVGGNIVNIGPAHGAPHINDRLRGRRMGDIEAFGDILKVTHALGILHWQGGVVVEPQDLPVATRHLDMYQAHIALSDAVWAARGVGGVAARDAIAMSAIEHQCSLDDLAREPRLLIVTNVNSPRRVDGEILDCIMTMAEHGQCVCITPFTLMGAMAPVTLAGALVQQTAEALAVIALVQMIRPGTPCVLGGFTSNVDMRTGAPAFGTPEYVNATLGGAQIARALKIPYRSSSVCVSPVVDAQSTYETSFSLWAAVMGHCHLISHGVGWLEGGLSISLEKIIVDAEMIRVWAKSFEKVEVTSETLALDAIGSVPPGGHFFGAEHTLARYETAFYQPMLADWSNFETWQERGERTATDRATDLWQAYRDAYVAPPLDEGVREEIAGYVERRKREIIAAT